MSYQGKIHSVNCFFGFQVGQQLKLVILDFLRRINRKLVFEEVDYV